MLRAWNELENAILEADEIVGAAEPQRRTKYKVLQNLIRKGSVTEEFMQVFNQLGAIVEKVLKTANKEIDSFDSERFITLATNFTVQIRRAAEKKPYNSPLSTEGLKRTG